MAAAHSASGRAKSSPDKAITIPQEVLEALDAIPNMISWEPWEDRVIMHYAKSKGFNAIGRILKKSGNTVARRYRFLLGEE